MALSPSYISDGVYNIFSVQYSGQDADLLNPGGVNGVIGGYQYNLNSQRMQWNLTNDPDNFGQFTLVNQEVTTYASYVSSDPGSQVVGDPNYPTAWTAYSTSDNPDQYAILLVGADVAWALSDGNDRTPITLESVGIQSGAADNQFWTFQLPTDPE